MLGEPEARHQPDAEHEREERQARIAEDRQSERSAKSRRPPQGSSLLGCDDRGEHDGRRQELVEDLAIEMDVVPYEVRMERGAQRPPRATPGDTIRRPIA